MEIFWQEFINSLAGSLPLFGILLAILVVGWLLARLVKALVLRLLTRTHLDDKLAEWLGQEDPSVLNESTALWGSRVIKLLTIAIALRFAYTVQPVKLLVDQIGEFVTFLSTQSIFIFIVDLLLFVLSTWILIRVGRLVNVLFESFYVVIEGWRDTRIKSIKIQRLELLTADRLTNGLLVTARYLRVLVLVLLGLVYLSVIFSFFPQTRGLVNGLLQNILAAIEQGWLSFLAYLPNLLNLALIFILTRYALKFLHFLAHEVEKGSLTLAGFYPDWAEPTYQLARILMVGLSLVIAFPYLPGSASPAFQGLSIFFGFLFSLGSSSVVANIVAGIVLTYTRAFKLGDRVKISDTIGDVIERNLLVTRIRTIKNVDITVPNGMVLGSHIINYSSSAKNHGLILNTTITLGYDVPWRKVHETLVEAALATPGILSEPRPFVFQTSLDDFYVSYEINAFTNRPNEMAKIYSALHSNIQDKCNQADIEILSPHYAAVRDGHHTTIPAEYLPEDYKPPSFRVGKTD